MGSPLTLFVAIFGVLLVAGIAAVLCFKSRRAGGPGVDAPDWTPDPSLADGHRFPDPAALSCQLLGLARQLLDAAGAVVLSPSDTGWKVTLVSPGLIVSFSRSLPLKEGILGLAFDGEKEIVADPVQPPAVGYLPGQGQPLSLAVVPLTHRGRVRALLACHRASGRPFVEADMAVLRRCAKLLDGWETHAAHNSEMARVLDQEERLSRGLQAMLGEGDIDELAGHILDALFDLLPAAYGFCLVHDPKVAYDCFYTKRFPDQFPKGFALQEKTWAYWVFAKGCKALYLDGAASRDTAMPILCAGEPFHAGAIAYLSPLQTGDQFIGVVGLVGKPEDAFPERDREAADRFLLQASALIKLSALNRFNEDNAITDGLTGLFNRRYFEEQVVKEMNRSQRDGTPMGLLLVDIDHFKRVNDNFGHPAGDSVLRAVAQALDGATRSVDIACRFGGEEFAAILPACPIAEAKDVAERVRRAVETLPTGQGGLPAQVTVSVGVAAFPKPFNSPTGLLKGADGALYSAKSKGRNRVEVAVR